MPVTQSMKTEATTASATSPKQVYVFDSAVPELQTLIDAGTAADSTNPNPTIIVLQGASDGVLQLASALAGAHDLDAIHIFSHGSAGSLQLGSAVLNDASLNGYSDELAHIGRALPDTGDLLQPSVYSFNCKLEMQRP